MAQDDSEDLEKEDRSGEITSSKGTINSLDDSLEQRVCLEGVRHDGQSNPPDSSYQSMVESGMTIEEMAAARGIKETSVVVRLSMLGLTGTYRHAQKIRFGESGEPKEDQSIKRRRWAGKPSYQSMVQSGMTIEEMAAARGIKSNCVKVRLHALDLTGTYRQTQKTRFGQDWGLKGHDPAQSDPKTSARSYQQMVKSGMSIEEMAASRDIQAASARAALYSLRLMPAYHEAMDLRVERGGPLNGDDPAQHNPRSRRHSYLSMVESGMTIEEMAAARGIKETSVVVRLSMLGLTGTYRHAQKIRFGHGEAEPLAMVPPIDLEHLARLADLGIPLPRMSKFLGGIPQNQVRRILRDADLLFDWRAQNARRRGERYCYEGLREKVEAGLTLEQIGDSFGVTKERIRQVTQALGWDRRRMERKSTMKHARPAEIQRLAMQLSAMAEHACKNDPATSATLKYYSGNHLIRGLDETAWNRVYSLFSAYFEAKSKGERISLQKLAEISGYYPTTIGYILKRMGEAPMFRTQIRVCLTKEQKALLRRAASCESRLGCKEKGYFIGIPPYCIADHCRRNGIPQKGEIAVHHRRNVAATYSMCAELYEAIELGFTKQEAMYLAGIKHEKACDRALERQDEIKAEIDKFLMAVGLPRRYAK